MSYHKLKWLSVAALSAVALTGCPKDDASTATSSGSTSTTTTTTPTTPSVNDNSGKAVTFSSSQGKIADLQKVEQPKSVPSGLEFPNGFFNYTITGVTRGGTVTVTVKLPEGTSPDSVVKCENNVCSNFAGAVISGDTITLTLTDGGAGDADKKADGVITDPFAPARDTKEYAAIVTSTPFFEAGAHSVIEVDDKGVGKAKNRLDPSLTSDLAIATHGKFLYRIARFQTDKINRYDIAAPDVGQWGEEGFSTNDTGDFSANAYDLVFVSDTKAYLIRYGTSKIWIVDPSTTTEAGFKKGEISLASYADADGTPEMSAAVVVGNRLYVAMQRYENFSTLKTAYLAVIDTATDTEIDTTKGGADQVKGLPLLTKNPVELLYSADDDKLYVASAGDYGCGFCSPTTPPVYSGGVEQIDRTAFTSKQVVDDNATTGNIGNIAIASNTLGYFVSSVNFGTATLYRFDPSKDSTQTITPVAEMAGKDLSFAAMGRDAFLWVGVSTYNDAAKTGVAILDTTNADALDQFISTELNPRAIAIGETTK